MSATAHAQVNGRQEVSVEQCTAMLQSIDPYQPRVQVDGKVSVFGSTSMDAMAHGWSAGFKRFHRGAEIVVSAAGSEATFAELLKNPGGVGMLSRPVTEKELADLKKKGLKQPVAFTVAHEALGVFVHPDNPVKSISGKQLRAVFTGNGEVTWGQLGATGEWASKPIHVISRGERSGTQKFLQDFVFAGSELRPGVSAHASNAEVIKAISGDSLAIGICGLRSNHKSVKPLQLMSGASVVPSDDHAILMGQYPLTRPLTMLLDVGQTSDDGIAAQEFVHYSLCQAGQAEAILVGFFPVDLPLLRAGLQKLGSANFR